MSVLQKRTRTSARASKAASTNSDPPVEAEPAKRARATPKSTKSTPAIPTAPTPKLTAKDLAALTPAQCHSIIISLIARDPTAGPIVTAHIAGVRQRKAAKPLDFQSLADSACKLLSSYPNKYKRDDVADKINEKIKVAVEKMLEGCEEATCYATRLSAFTSMISIARQVIECDDWQLRETMGGAGWASDGLVTVWEMMVKHGEAERLKTDKEDYYKQLADLWRRFLGEPCNPGDYFYEIAKALSKDGNVPDEEE